LPDPLRIAVGLPIGKQGAYFTGGTGFCGQDDDASTLDSNVEPEGVPDLWCQWGPDETGQHMGWNGGEKFYRYKEWAEYIIEHFLNRWGVKMNGVVRYQGERKGDFGTIQVVDNVVSKLERMKMKPTFLKVMARNSSMIWGVENVLLDSVKALDSVRKIRG
jgi:hypothetical protein